MYILLHLVHERRYKHYSIMKLEEHKHIQTYLNSMDYCHFVYWIF